LRPLERIALLEMEHDSLSVPEISQSCKSMKLLLRLGENVEEQEEEGLENDLGENGLCSAIGAFASVPRRKFSNRNGSFGESLDETPSEKLLRMVSQRDVSANESA